MKQTFIGLVFAASLISGGAWATDAASLISGAVTATLEPVGRYVTQWVYDPDRDGSEKYKRLLIVTDTQKGKIKTCWFGTWEMECGFWMSVIK